MTARIPWSDVVAVAKGIVESYDTLVTLRQLFYRLVAAEILPNTTGAYKGLSAKTAEARRAGEFPDLMDRTREIHQFEHFAGVGDALDSLTHWYRRDRTEGQQWSVYLGVEKNGLVEQMTTWFGDRGIPVLALGGYSGQGYVDRVVRHVEAQARPAVLLYAGDHDPSGEDIDRDFVHRTACWAKVERVALTAGQVEEYQLPPQPGKTTDSRARGFIEKHGRLVQVEVDALPPDTLRALFERALAAYWDTSTYERVLANEDREREELRRLASLNGGAW